MKIYTVTGCIAAGKTTLAEHIADAKRIRFVTEDCDGNPFLENYYGDMKEYAYRMQMWYLSNRISQLLRVRGDSAIVQDQMLQAFGFIFPSLQMKNGYLGKEEFASIVKTLNLFYEQDELFGAAATETIFYLRVKESDVNVLIDRIRKERGREYEASIEEGYLVKLIREYESWFERCIASGIRDVVMLDAFAPMKDNVSLAISRIS